MGDLSQRHTLPLISLFTSLPHLSLSLSLSLSTRWPTIEAWGEGTLWCCANTARGLDTRLELIHSVAQQEIVLLPSNKESLNPPH